MFVSSTDVGSIISAENMIGRGLLYTGVALILASALRSLLDILQSDTIDPWSIVLAAGCILASIGLGMTGFKPWDKIQEMYEEISSQFGERNP